MKIKLKTLLASTAAVSIGALATPVAALPTDSSTTTATVQLSCDRTSSSAPCAQTRTALPSSDPTIEVDSETGIVTSTATTETALESTYRLDGTFNRGDITPLSTPLFGFANDTLYSQYEGVVAVLGAIETITSVTTSTPNEDGGFDVNTTTDDAVTSDAELTSLTGKVRTSTRYTAMLEETTAITTADGEVGKAAYTGGSVSTDGIEFLSATGTATFDPETGYMSVEYDETTASRTSLDIDGLRTTGTVTAASVSTGDVFLVTDENAEGTSLVGTLAALAATDVALGESIDEEAVTRAAADVALQTNIDAEAVTRAAADVALGGRITTESTARIAADTGLGNRITTESNARSAADLAEANARIAADNALGSRITNETNARIAADDVLRDKIASSTATAIALGGNAILPDANFTLAGNVGFYEGAQALSINAAGRVGQNVYLTGAVGGGLNKGGKVGGRVGVVFGF